MEDYLVLQSREAPSGDTVIDADKDRIHEIEDEGEYDKEELKLKRKASAEEVDKLKKTKLDQGGHLNVKTK